MPEPISQGEAERMRQLVETLGTALVLAHKALRSEASDLERRNAQEKIEKYMPQLRGF